MQMASSMSMDISIIIPVIHSADSLNTCLEALSHQDYPPDKYEIIIIYNKERSDIKSAVDKKNKEVKAKVVVLESDSAVRAAMRNAGIRLARAPLIGFMDDDCIPEGNWLKEIQTFHSSYPEAAIYGSNLMPYYYDFPAYSSALRDIIADRKKKSSAPSTRLLSDPYSIGGYLATGNLAAKKEVLSKLGGFNEQLKGLADVELCLRALEAGYRVYIYNAMVVIWVQTAAIIPNMRKYFKWAAVTYVILLKHLKKEAVFVFAGSNHNYFFKVYSPYPFIIIITPGIAVFLLSLLSWFFPYLGVLILAYVGLHYVRSYHYFRSIKLVSFYMISSFSNCIAQSLGLLCGFRKNFFKESLR